MWDPVIEILTDLVLGGMVVAGIIILGAVVIALTMEVLVAVKKGRAYIADAGGSFGGYGKELAKDIGVMLGTGLIGAIPIAMFLNWELIKSIVESYLIRLLGPFA